MSDSRNDAQSLTCLTRLGAAPADKAAAIREAAQMLVAAGCIDPDYSESMMKREDAAETYLGSGVAIPHGMVQDRAMVRKDGIAVLQVPAGLTWNDGQTVRLVVAIAANSDAHIDTLRRLTRLLQDGTLLETLFTTADVNVLRDAFGAEVTIHESSSTEVDVSDLDESFEWQVDYPNGLHARPASAWIEAARATTGRIQVRHGSEVADAKGLVDLLQLGLHDGDTIIVSADGPDAKDVLVRFRDVITSLSAQEKADAEQAAARAAAPADAWSPPSGTTFRAGLGASPGLAIGPLHVLSQGEIEIPDTPAPQLGEGGAALHEALQVTKQRLKVLADDTVRRLGESEGKIFLAQAELLNDIDLVTVACQHMVEGHGVAKSWYMAVEQAAKRLEQNGNELLAARAADMRDVGRRVLSCLLPDMEELGGNTLPDEPAILVADDLAPSDTASLDADQVLAIVTVQGGPTSHTSILARTLGLPAVVGSEAEVLKVKSGTMAIVDGIAGRIVVDPSEEALASARAWLAEREEQAKREQAERGFPAKTTDGHQVEVAANINRPDQAELALSNGAEGVGLMRTEFLFLERSSSPTEDEQFEIYRDMLKAMEGRPVIVRALDIGGDKQVPHLNLPREENPFLGVRGARLLLRRPDLMVPQLRALYRAAAEGGKLSIMFPMITSVHEMKRLRDVSDSIRKELKAPEVPLGAMVEVPAAAVGADVLAKYVDFFSIGTNDLTQYTLAIDRQHPDLAKEADSLHPCVLRLIRATVEGAAKHGKWVGVCGGIAGDPFGAAVLTGLGVNELSMTPRDVAAVKARIRSTDFASLKALATRALACETAEEVRALNPGGK